MPSEYPEDDSRTTPFQGGSELSTRRAPETKTRYVDVPQSPERAVGPRNLAWGVIFLVAGLCAYRFARIFAGHDATRSIVASLGTFGLIWLFYSLRVLRQRHGIFLALSVILLFGAVLPLVELGFSKLENLATERMGEEKSPSKLDVAPPPPLTAKTAPPAPVAPDEPPPVEDAPPALVKAGKSAPMVDENIVRELMVPDPPETAKQIVEITDDVEVTIRGRKFLLKKGRIFEFLGMKEGMTTIKAGDDTTTVSSDFTRFKFTFKQRYLNAQREAVRLYPKLGEKFSTEYDLYIAASRELRETLPDFEKDPEWPLNLAKQVASARGWRSTDEIAAEATRLPEPTAPANPPAEGTEPAAPEIPKAPDVPQENPLPPIPPGE
jgi:hypothetical protein